jgi:hypothetical protein
MVFSTEAAPDTLEIPEGADPELFRRVHDALPVILKRSDEILLGSIAVAGLSFLTEGESEELNLGTSRLCTYASDAVTRAAEEIGLPTARERLKGYHFITYFGQPKTKPSENDIVLCRTWGQFDEQTYENPKHPNGGRPFLGTRRQLSELLPHMGSMLQPDGVEVRSVTHQENPDHPGGAHRWLKSTP